MNSKGAKLEDLPDEILLAVLQYLDPIDILRSRQSCSRIYSISLDISLWASVADHLSQSLPLPSRTRISTFSLPELEQTTVQAVNVEKQWLSYRTASLRKISATYQNDTEEQPRFRRPEGIKLFEDRYAVVCYPGPCTVVLWDVDGLRLGDDGRSVQWGRILATWTDRGVISYNSYQAEYHEASKEIFVTFFTMDDTRYISNVLSVSISGLPAQMRQFRQVVRIVQDGESFMLPLTALDPESSCIAQYLLHPDAIKITNWQHGYSKTIPSENRDDSDELGSTLVAIEIIDPYIVVVKGRTLKIFAIPPGLNDKEGLGQSSAQIETIHLPDVHFNRAALSRLPMNKDPTVPLSVALVLTDMFTTVSYYIIHLPRKPSSILTSTLVLVGQDVSLATRDVFMSTELALGPLGMRGAWIEKSRGSMERRVVAFSADNEQPGGMWRMRTAQIYSTFSPDFDQDLRFITCDEVTGRMVIVTRGGELWVLDCWRKVPAEPKPLTRFRGS